ncbi:MAG: DUF501 domain-containing protein [Coriobacteriia bacterium]|nr:DUF501 domain-containing protein [Coriobacteriia bacterium]
MSGGPDALWERESELVAAQIGRTPREPYRVAARCSFHRPTVIVSPSRLADGTPFPTLAWLTCPHLAEAVAAEESSGAVARFAARAASDESLAGALRALDARVRELRAAESGGVDACPTVGIGGQRDPLGVKCLHLHVALALLGEADPIGAEFLAGVAHECVDDRCAGPVCPATEQGDA